MGAPELQCAACGCWYSADEDGCPYCGNDNVADARGFEEWNQEQKGDE